MRVLSWFGLVATTGAIGLLAMVSRLLISKTLNSPIELEEYVPELRSKGSLWFILNKGTLSKSQVYHLLASFSPLYQSYEFYCSDLVNQWIPPSLECVLLNWNSGSWASSSLKIHFSSCKAILHRLRNIFKKKKNSSYCPRKAQDIESRRKPCFRLVKSSLLCILQIQFQQLVTSLFANFFCTALIAKLLSGEAS